MFSNLLLEWEWFSIELRFHKHLTQFRRWVEGKFQLIPAAQSSTDHLSVIVNSNYSGFAGNRGYCNRDHNTGFLKVRTKKGRVIELITHNNLAININYGLLTLWLRPYSENHGLYHCVYPLVDFVHQVFLNYNGLPLHGGLSIINDRGVVFAGKSGSGKSTLLKLTASAWDGQCDDEVSIRLFSDSKVFAYPFPTLSKCVTEPNSGHSCDIHKRVPVPAIFFIEKSDCNSIKKLNISESIVHINSSAMEIFRRYLNGAEGPIINSLTTKVFNNAVKIAQAVPCYKLEFSTDCGFMKLVETEI